MDEQVGTPEGRRIIGLLWDPPGAPSRGPKPRLTLAEVVDAAVALADTEGLAALSVRKVAARVDLSAMALYTYVPGRSELVELMIDRVYAECRLPSHDLDWRERLGAWTRAIWRLYRAHPWVLDHAVVRLPVGPHVLDVEEALYAALAAAGFVGTDNVSMANLVRWQLLGAARSAVQDADAERRTGVSADAYWDSRSSFWTTYFDAERFPTTHAVWLAGGFDDPTAGDFEQVVRRLMDAIDAMRPR